MPPPVPPVSRELVHIIREVYKCEGRNVNEDVKAITDRQAKEIEYYIRACVVRLERVA